MRSFRSDPYLWIHLAGLAALPIFLELCLVGLSVGDPMLPVWLELSLVATIGIAPILWMQWQRPFYIFSTVVIALKPEQLTEDQRRLLTLFKSQRNRLLAVGVSLVLLVLLRQIYDSAAIAAGVVPLPITGRWFGLLLAAVGFLASNLFLQVPVSVASVMLRSDSTFAAALPHPLEQIRQSFTSLGLQVNRILPPILPEAPPSLVVSVPTSPQPVAVDGLEVASPPENAPPSIPPDQVPDAASEEL